MYTKGEFKDVCSYEENVEKKLKNMPSTIRVLDKG